MRKVDKSNFYRFLEDFPSQIDESMEIVEKISLTKPEIGKFNQVLITGMGGSAIAGDVLAAYLEDCLPLPVIVNRKETLPAYVSEKTLVIISSNSGNTSETLSAYKMAKEKNSTMIILTSGGKLQKLAEKDNIQTLIIPAGLPPRQAFGYAFFTILFLLSKWNWIKLDDATVKDVKKTVKTLLKRNSVQKNHQSGLAFNIARAIYKKIPIIYTATTWLEPVLTRWRNQFNENSKSLAFSNIIPEMNHNEIVGWDMDFPEDDYFVILFLRDYNETGERMKRLLYTREIIAKKCQNIVDIFPEGETRLGKIISMIYLGDWISYYLALFYGKDPIEIKNIDYLKAKLS